VFNRQINKNYRKLLKTLLTSSTKSEILTGIRQLQTIQINRCLKNFTQTRPNSRFDVNTILFKNPFYREVMRDLILADLNPPQELWEQRLHYWEPLFYQFEDRLINT
jgi:hypothetical protein